MARRDSPLHNFIMDALMGDKYPFILYWIDTNEGIFCLKCICKSKKEWTPLHSKIFDDYHNLKPRKSNDKRQRFLVAMKACPFIEPLDDISTKEEKYYKFRPHGTSVDAIDKIATLSASNEMEMQENPLHEMDAINGSPVAENGPPPGDPSMEGIVDGNDLGNCLSPILADSNDPFLDVLNDPQICQLLQRVESYVPDEAASVPESPGIGASPSLYDDSADVMRSSPSCSQALGSSSSDEWNLPAQELSCPFGVMESIPPDYDPAKAFLESMGTPKLAKTTADPNSLGIVQTVPVSLGESAKCPSVKIVKLNDNDGIVRSLRGDNSEKKFFMMVLKTGK